MDAIFRMFRTGTIEVMNELLDYCQHQTAFPVLQCAQVRHPLLHLYFPAHLRKTLHVQRREAVMHHVHQGRESAFSHTAHATSLCLLLKGRFLAGCVEMPLRHRSSMWTIYAAAISVVAIVTSYSRRERGETEDVGDVCRQNSVCMPIPRDFHLGGCFYCASSAPI
jgi:hypothetical protein